MLIVFKETVADSKHKNMTHKVWYLRDKDGLVLAVCKEIK